MLFFILNGQRIFFDSYKEAYEYINNNSINSEIFGVRYLANDNVLTRNDVLEIIDIDNGKSKKYTQVPSKSSKLNYNANIYYELVYIASRQVVYYPHDGSLEDIYLELLKRNENISENILNNLDKATLKLRK